MYSEECGFKINANAMACCYYSAAIVVVRRLFICLLFVAVMLLLWFSSSVKNYYQVDLLPSSSNAVARRNTVKANSRPPDIEKKHWRALEELLNFPLEKRLSVSPVVGLASKEAHRYMRQTT